MIQNKIIPIFFSHLRKHNLMVTKTIYFYAKVGDLNEKPYGGGEVGNRRTMEMMTNLGYNVRLLPRYYNYKKKSVIVYVQMILGDFFSLLNLFCVLLFQKRERAVVHISGFTGLYMPLEFLSVLTSRLLGYKVTYEIRGGGIIGFYNDGNFVYKWMFRKAINYADTVFSQVYENKELISSKSRSAFFYYPNCVKEDFMPAECPKKPIKPINIIYMGRISPQKNIDIILQTFKKVHDLGVDVKLDIIGGGEDYPEYFLKNKEYIIKNELQNICIFHGKMNKLEMVPFLENATFFLFPTKEKREGQSNALTELMSFGIIPIASSQGYTRTIVDCDNLIEDELTPDAYSAKLLAIVASGQIGDLSSQMYNRIKKHYTYSNIQRCLKNEYERIMMK